MHRDEVFVAGGQPSVTYVSREDHEVDRSLARAIAAPNQIVSLSGPTKTGKTVLCRKVLATKQFVWIDGGKVKTTGDFWDAVSHELRAPYEETEASGTETEATGELEIPAIMTAGGSKLWKKDKSRVFRINTLANALAIMTEERIVLVIDDFHYIPSDVRTDIVRNLKGAVFNGLKIILLSVSHRAFDAIKAEPELTGRFTSVNLPPWTLSDLRQIPAKGFEALRVDCPESVVETLCEESQENPFLMQKFCWEICFDLGIEQGKVMLLPKHKVPDAIPLKEMFVRLAKDAGLPIYQQLSAGPQARKQRAKRPMRDGEESDIYEVTLKAIAATGPKSSISYEEIRAKLSEILLDRVPQKNEVTSALKHLTRISREIGAESAIDWDEEKREVAVADPYLRFYLRWQVRD